MQITWSQSDGYRSIATCEKDIKGPNNANVSLYLIMNREQLYNVHKESIFDYRKS